MRSDLPKLLCLTLVVPMTLGGCLRFKGWEAFTSSTARYEYKREWTGDPYSYGGTADATGGLQPRTRYGGGAREGTNAKIDPYYNRPAKGSGLHPGENSPMAASGYGHTNAPSLQSEPGAFQNPSVRSAR